MPVTFTANDSAALRTFFEDSYEDLAYRDHALMGICEKLNRHGDSVKVPMAFGYTAGRGGTFTTAQTNESNISRVAFLVTPQKTYGVQKVDNFTAALTSDKKGAVVSFYSDAIEKSMRACSDDVEWSLFSDGFGTMATISSNSGGGPYVLTLTNPGDVYRFQSGFVLVSKATPSSAALDTGTISVTNLDPVAGTITVAASGGWTPTNTHVLGLQGTMAASTSLITWAGLQGWLPDDLNRGSLSTTFYGVDRSQYPTLLAGNYLNATQMNVKQAVYNLAVQIGPVSGSKPDVALMSYSNYGKLEILEDTRAQHIQAQGDGISVFYEGLKVVGPKGPIVCIPATFCDASHIYVLDSSTWKMGSPGGQFIVPATRNGEPVELSTDDANEVRMRGGGYFWCTAPGYNGVARVTP
jgi:hypothetical protein